MLSTKQAVNLSQRTTNFQLRMKLAFFATILSNLISVTSLAVKIMIMLRLNMYYLAV